MTHVTLPAHPVHRPRLVGLAWGAVLLATILHAAMDTMFIAVSPLGGTTLFLTAWALVTGLTALVALASVLSKGGQLGYKRAV